MCLAKRGAQIVLHHAPKNLALYNNWPNLEEGVLGDEGVEVPAVVVGGCE